METAFMRFVGAFVLVAAIIGFGWIFSLPSKAECVATGRIVDPTERHCDSPSGYQQLEEHALFHSLEVVLAVAIVLVGSYAVRRYRRHRSTPTAPTG